MTGQRAGGVRIAVIDSGVHAQHPHVNGVAGGVAFDASGREHGDLVDRLGHGTAIAAAIRDQAPDAEIFAVKVFDRQLSTPIGHLVQAIEWAAREGMHIANLSLGTARREHAAALRAAIEIAIAHQLLVVAAREDDGVLYWPGCLEGVLPVQVDWTCSRREFRVVQVEGRAVVRASGLPREIPGVPPSRNLHGVSFAVANTTGCVARVIEGLTDRSLDAVLERIASRAEGS
jgi:hypothetical protein